MVENLSKTIKDVAESAKDLKGYLPTFFKDRALPERGSENISEPVIRKNGEGFTEYQKDLLKKEYGLSDEEISSYSDWDDFEDKFLNKQELSEEETNEKQEGDVLKNQTDTPNNPDAQNEGIRTPRESELMALKIYGGEEQVSYLNGKKVPFGTPGSTRPDIMREVDGKLEAIEVKNYDLNSKNSLNELLNKLAEQVKDRVDNLPPDTLQRIVLDVSGKQITSEQLESIIKAIKEKCAPFYLDIPIDTI